MSTTSSTTANSITQAAASQIIDQELKKLGFEVVDPTIYHKFSVSSAAKEKEGKTTWAFSAPGPIGAISTDTGTEAIAKNFLSQKPIIINYFKSADELQQDGGKNDKTRQEMYEREWERMKSSILAMVRSTRIRTLIIDTATEAWELCRLAEFGKLTQVMPHHYTTVNSEFKALIKAADENPRLNSIWIHKKKKEYKTGSSGKDSWTGRWERAGFGDMPFLVDVNLEHFFQPAGAMVSDGSGGNVSLEEGRFGIRVVDSRYNMLSVVGQEFTREESNFENLGYALFPDTYGSDVWRTK